MHPAHDTHTHTHTHTHTLSYTHTHALPHTHNTRPSLSVLSSLVLTCPQELSSAFSCFVLRAFAFHTMLYSMTCVWKSEVPMRRVIFFWSCCVCSSVCALLLVICCIFLKELRHMVALLALALLSSSCITDTVFLFPIFSGEHGSDYIVFIS